MVKIWASRSTLPASIPSKSLSEVHDLGDWDSSSQWWGWCFLRGLSWGSSGRIQVRGWEWCLVQREYPIHISCFHFIRKQPVSVKSARKECEGLGKSRSQGVKQWFCQFKIVAVGFFSSLSMAHGERWDPAFKSLLIHETSQPSPGPELSLVQGQPGQRLACLPFLRVNCQGWVQGGSWGGRKERCLESLGFPVQMPGWVMLLLAKFKGKEPPGLGWKNWCLGNSLDSLAL